MVKTVIIGSGNVAWALAEAMAKAGNPPVQIFARNTHEGQKIAHRAGSGFASTADALAEADLYILAVSDKAVAQLAASLSFGSGVVAHTAGSVPLDAIPAKITRRGVLYPLQTFTKGREVDFTQVPFFIEAGDSGTLEILREFASGLSADVRVAGSKERACLHMAAVFASNFTNYMYTVGEMLAADAGFGFDVLKPLVAETAAKALGASSPRDTQTGPAVRNDFQTKSLHCEMLTEKPDLKNIYINLSKNIWETSKKI